MVMEFGTGETTPTHALCPETGLWNRCIGAPPLDWICGTFPAMLPLPPPPSTGEAG